MSLNLLLDLHIERRQLIFTEFCYNSLIFFIYWIYSTRFCRVVIFLNSLLIRISSLVKLSSITLWKNWGSRWLITQSAFSNWLMHIMLFNLLFELCIAFNCFRLQRFESLPTKSLFFWKRFGLEVGSKIIELERETSNSSNW
jgi:hypothetical protein